MKRNFLKEICINYIVEQKIKCNKLPLDLIEDIQHIRFIELKKELIKETRPPCLRCYMFRTEREIIERLPNCRPFYCDICHKVLDGTIYDNNPDPHVRDRHPQRICPVFACCALWGGAIGIWWDHCNVVSTDPDNPCDEHDNPSQDHHSIMRRARRNSADNDD